MSDCTRWSFRRKIEWFRCQFAQHASLPFSEVLPAQVVASALQATCLQCYDSLYNPVTVLWLFLGQVMHANPTFESADDLHVNSYFLDGAGVAIAGITIDMDGVTRSDPPDIGAYEYSSTLTPMSGTYTIFGNAPDFTSIKQATDSLHLKGVSGPVTFNIREIFNCVAY